MQRIRFTRIYNYLRTGKLNRYGKSVIYIKAYLRGRNRYIPTGMYIKPHQWDRKALRVVDHPNYTNLNRELSQIETQLEQIESKIIKCGGVVTLSRLKEQYDNSQVSFFTDFIKKHLEKDKGKLAKCSYTDQKQTLDKLLSFKLEIGFDQLTYSLVYDFDSHLYGLGLGVNTIAKHHKNIRKYINLAIAHKFITPGDNPYLKFRVKRKPTDRIALTEQELIQIENIVIPSDKKHLQKFKDFFLFCSWTGLRYSDASRLTSDNFSVSKDALIMRFVSKKTDKPFEVNLNNLFGGKPARLIRNYLKVTNPKSRFFTASNQATNKGLKEMVVNTKIRSKVKSGITCHTARHTFGSILSTKVKTPILQKLMQHSKISETMVYVQMNNKTIDDQLGKVNWG